MFNASHELDDGNYTYLWHFGDGTGGADITVTRTFRKAGTYPVTLHVSDGKVTNTSSVTMEVVNVPPTANAGAEKERATVAGEPVILDGSASTDTPSDLPGLNFTWRVGNDTLYGKVVWYTFEIPGTYNVTLRVRDEDGAVSEDTITFQVAMPLEPEKEEKGMMTGFAWLLLVVVVLLLVLLFLLSGKGFVPPVEVGGFAGEVVVEMGEKAIRPEIDNAMFRPPGEATPEPITGEKDGGTGKDGEPVTGEKDGGTGKDGEPITSENEEGTGKDGEPIAGEKEAGTGEGGEPITSENEEGTGKDEKPTTGERKDGAGKTEQQGINEGEEDRAPDTPDGPGEGADAIEERKEMDGEQEGDADGPNTTDREKPGETGGHSPPENREPLRDEGGAFPWAIPPDHHPLTPQDADPVPHRTSLRRSSHRTGQSRQG